MKSWGLTNASQQAAVFSFSPIDGRILVYAGGKNYGESQFDRVTQAIRPPGSAFKPILYAAAMEKGISPNDLVDDSPIMLKTLKENLRDDYDIATAISGKVALKFLERRKTDLILLDYEMPICDGSQVLEMIRANDAIKDIPVIFLTGVTDSGKIKEALVLKPQGYLLKPINREKLLEAITRVLE